MKLSGQVAIITGGARDIGRAISIKLASMGAKVVVNYFNNENDAKDTLAEIHLLGGEAVSVKADITKMEDCLKLVSEAKKAFGDEIHILINNAGGLIARKKLIDMDLEFWNLVLNLNLTSVFMMHKATVPHMPEGSNIVNVSSLAGRDGGGEGASAYASAKGGLMSFTRGMAKELGPKGIRVNSVCPGLINTTFHDRFTPDNVREIVSSRTPLKREGTAAEVASVIGALVSDEFSFVSGNNIDINGGLAFS